MRQNLKQRVSTGVFQILWSSNALVRGDIKFHYLDCYGYLGATIAQVRPQWRMIYVRITHMDKTGIGNGSTSGKAAHQETCSSPI